MSQAQIENLTNYPSLDGRHVLVTGGASGIGEALVKALAQQGCAVSFFDIDEEAGDDCPSWIQEQLDEELPF